MVEEQNSNLNSAGNTDVTDEISKELKINLPGQNLPTILRFITFFTLIGGLSIIGDSFAEIVRQNKEDPIFYFMRVTVGLLALASAYGITERKRWAIWCYGLIALIALLANPILSLIPGAVVIYLHTQRKLFTPSVFDLLLDQLTILVKTLLRRNNPPTF